jgi:hypothetical protein
MLGEQDGGRGAGRIRADHDDVGPREGHAVSAVTRASGG